MTEWLLWALFGSHKDGIQKEWEDEINGYISKFEKLQGRELQIGHNEDIECMKVSLDPVVTSHRPLLWYLVSPLFVFYRRKSTDGMKCRSLG